MKKRIGIAGFALALAAASVAAESDTVLYFDREVDVTPRSVAGSAPSDLWISPEKMTEITDFVLKPEGLCLEELCIPVEISPKSSVARDEDDVTWINLPGFAQRTQQSYVHDEDRSVWSFGAIPATRSSFLQGGQAPDFVLPNRKGEPVRLSEFRGRKVLLISWASW